MSVTKTVFLILAFFASTIAHAECFRTRLEAKSPPGFDGPGSWGKLHNTVTLDCLHYVGSLSMNGVVEVLIRDETGVVHRLKVGDFMGENTGRITRIEDDRIYIEQTVRANGGTRSVLVTMDKDSGAGNKPRF